MAVPNRSGTIAYELGTGACRWLFPRGLIRLARHAAIAVTNPFTWPYVRRGSERLLHDLSEYLNDRDHPVEIYAMGPVAATSSDGGIRTTILRQRLDMRFRQLNSCHYFAYALQKALAASRARIVHCLNYFDAFAALGARRRYGLSYKIVFQAVGIPTARYFRAVPIDRWMIHRVFREADAVATLSTFARDSLEADFGVRSTVLPPPVHMDDGSTAAVGDDRAIPGTRLLFVGDVNEPRKGAAALCRAFVTLRRQIPDATLTFSGRASEATIAALLAQSGVAELRDSIRFLGTGKVEDLPALYRSATLTVVPSVWEAFGLVLIESMAAGTPVVATRHAGMTDVVNSDDVGVLFEPGDFVDRTENDEGLAAAILEALEAVGRKDPSAACVHRAREFSWAVLGPRYEALYRSIASESSFETGA